MHRCGRCVGRFLDAEQTQQLVLLLADPAPDGGQLDRPCRARQVAMSLGDADQPPAKVAEDLPPPDDVRVERPAAHLLVCRGQIVEGAHAGDPPGSAEAPGAHAEPADVLQGVSDVDQLPVEQRDQTVGVDQHVAEAQVSVHHGATRRFRPMPLEPPQRQLESW